jgi:hypothetical protein
VTIRAQQPARDIVREHKFLTQATGFAIPADFVEHCTRRLVQGEHEFGDRWTRIGLTGFVRELREEAADLGAWSALADQAVDLEHLPPAAAAEFAQILEQIARRGAQAHFDAGVLERLLADHQSSQEERTTHG